MKFDNVSGVKLLDNLYIEAVQSKQDIGLVRVSEGPIFEWKLTISGWKQAMELIEPFLSLPVGPFHQWLDENSDISILITADPEGRW